jgi:hypothetical protein
LNTHIIPAVQAHEAMIRERGVICLGLATLLSKVRYLRIYTSENQLMMCRILLRTT